MNIIQLNKNLYVAHPKYIYLATPISEIHNHFNHILCTSDCTNTDTTI